MKPNNVLFIVVLAAVLAAATAAGTSYLFLRHVPLGAASADQERVERIMRDYLTNNPEILVEMTNELWTGRWRAQWPVSWPASDLGPRAELGLLAKNGNPGVTGALVVCKARPTSW